MLLSIVKSAFKVNQTLEMKKSVDAASPALKGGKADVILKIRGSLNQGLNNCHMNSANADSKIIVKPFF